MFKLIKNEFAKIFYKKSTYALLIVSLLIGLGLNVIMYFNFSDYYYDGYYGYTFQDDINYLENSSDYDNDPYSEYADSIYRQVSIEMYKFLIDNEYTCEDDFNDKWSYDAAQTIFTTHKYLIETKKNELSGKGKSTQKDVIDIELEQEFYDKEIEAFLDGDYMAFYQAEIDYIKQNPTDDNKQKLKTYTYFIDNEIEPHKDNWQVNAVKNYTESETKYENLQGLLNDSNETLNEETSAAQEAYLINKYRLEHDLQYVSVQDSNNDYDNLYYYESSDFTRSFSDSIFMCIVAIIFVSIIASGIFSSEFSSGTIKFLLINPVKRSKIFWSKYITCISLTIISIIFFFIFQFVTSLIIHGSNGIDGAYIYVAGGTAESISIILYVFIQYMLSIVAAITTVTLAFMISAFARNSSLSIAISLVVLLAGSSISEILAATKQDWGRYLLFSNTNITKIIEGTPTFIGQTLTSVSITLVAYMIIFLLTAYDGFTKRDV